MSLVKHAIMNRLYIVVQNLKQHGKRTDRQRGKTAKKTKKEAIKSDEFRRRQRVKGTHGDKGVRNTHTYIYIYSI